MPAQVASSTTAGSYWLTSGLGFKFCEEQVLGFGTDFDESFLAKLEPMESQAQHATNTHVEDIVAAGSPSSTCTTITSRATAAFMQVEPELNLSSGQLTLNASALQFVVEILGEEEDEKMTSWEMYRQVRAR